MENEQSSEDKKISIWGRVVALVGVLIFLFTCFFALSALFLDLRGEQTTGRLSNVASCSGGKTCWTGQVDFTTNEGEEITIHPMNGRTVFEISGLLVESGYRDVEIRYLKSFPQIAKVTLAWHLEYLNKIIWLFWGSVVTFFGWVATRRKPIVLDFSKGK